MTKPDLLVVWPDTIDYPLFREWVHLERARFAKVIVVFSKTNWPFTDIIPFVQEAMGQDDVTFVISDPVEGRDWRDIAIKTGLQVSDSEWVFFTEQDFFPEKDLWEEINTTHDNVHKADVISVDQDGRMHPCCMFIKRSVLDKTSLDFAAKPPEHDHFGQIQKDLWNWEPPLIGCVINPKFYQHMNGLSHNMYLMMSGQPVTYQPEEFKVYLQKCLQIDLPLQDDFVEVAEEYLK